MRTVLLPAVAVAVSLAAVALLALLAFFVARRRKIYFQRLLLPRGAFLRLNLMFI